MTPDIKGHVSPRDVFIADDFRENSIIDIRSSFCRHAREQAQAPKKRQQRRCDHLERLPVLRQITPEVWLPDLWGRAFPDGPANSDLGATVRLWESIPPPLGLLEGGDEGDSEIDVIIETPTWVWFIEAKYRSDISLGTTTRPNRDQVIRNMDVGTYYAGVRQFFFSLLILSEDHSPKGVAKIREYEAQPSIVQDRLSHHRPDRLTNVKAIRTLKWADLMGVLIEASTKALRPSVSMHRIDIVYAD
jgi:hypothetical protein